MKRYVTFLALLIIVCLYAKAQPLAPQVNENVELMSILSRMAGFPEYHMDVAGQYITDIDSHFKDRTNHPVVQYMKKLRSEHGISYDAVMSMAVHLQKENGCFSLIKEETNTLEKRWDKVDKTQFLNLLTDFYLKSHFQSFFEAHKEFYWKGIQAYKEKVMQHFDISWYESFYGNKPDENFSIIIGFCNGGGNYGANRHIKEKGKEVFAIIGYFVNKNNEPQYSKEYLPTLIHEFNHSFINYLLDENKYPEHVKALEQAGTDLFKSSRWAMSRQAYGNWQTMINESLVRAAVICYMLDKKYAPEEIKNELSEQIQRNFRWMPELVRLLRTYEKEQSRYGSLEKFYPHIINFFSDYAEKENERLNIME